MKEGWGEMELGADCGQCGLRQRDWRWSDSQYLSCCAYLGFLSPEGPFQPILAL